MKDILGTILLFLLMLAPVIAHGDSEPEPRSYATPSGNGKFLFVMLAPGNTRPDEIRLVDQNGAVLQHVRMQYPTSGLYVNDGSIKALWTVDWYAFSVIVPSDGVHLIRRGPWAQHLSDEALTFLANGKVLRSYKISDLVDTAVGLHHTVSHFDWEESANLNDETHTFNLAILNKEKYTFDYATGEVLSSRRPIRAFLVVFAALSLWIAARLIRRKKTFAATAV